MLCTCFFNPFYAFTFNQFKSLRGAALHERCVQWLSREVAGAIHCFHEHALPFPDGSGFVPFSPRSYCVVLCLAHIGASLAQIEFSSSREWAPPNWERAVCSLWFQSPRVAGTSCLAPQPSICICHYRSPALSLLHRLRDGGDSSSYILLMQHVVTSSVWDCQFPRPGTAPVFFTLVLQRQVQREHLSSMIPFK